MNKVCAFQIAKTHLSKDDYYHIALLKHNNLYKAMDPHLFIIQAKLDN